MDERDKLQQQMSEIGDRYLRRTVGELARLQELLQKQREGVAEATQEIAHMAHKMHGSGAMFGFDAISDRARELELLAGSPPESDYQQKLQTLISALDAQVRETARQRGVQ
jgi:HPt (histidine-containing phosphotransfer) domain-containing protein